MDEHATTQEGAELPFDEVGQPPPRLVRAAEVELEPSDADTALRSSRNVCR